MIPEPNSTAVRTALWRALHIFEDQKPYIIEDQVGYSLIKPDKNWQERPDMKFTRRLPASTVARSRFIEDEALLQISNGIRQYIMLGSGLDTFAQRYYTACKSVDIFEIDQPETLLWKEKRLGEENFPLPKNLHFVPVDFEHSSWWDELLKSDFDLDKKTFVSCTGVTLYLTRKAIYETFLKLSSLSKGSSVVIAFYLPIEMLEEEDRAMQEIANKGAADAGTPFISFFVPEEVYKMAEECGFRNIQLINTDEIRQKYFKDRQDQFTPATGEYFLVASV